MEQTPILVLQQFYKLEVWATLASISETPVTKRFENLFSRVGSTQPHTSHEAPNSTASLHPKFSKTISGYNI